jgi:hypothetical protein
MKDGKFLKCLLINNEKKAVMKMLLYQLRVNQKTSYREWPMLHVILNGCVFKLATNQPFCVCGKFKNKLN